MVLKRCLALGGEGTYVGCDVADSSCGTGDAIVEINNTCHCNARESGQREGDPLHC